MLEVSRRGNMFWELIACVELVRTFGGSGAGSSAGLSRCRFFELLASLAWLCPSAALVVKNRPSRAAGWSFIACLGTALQAQHAISCMLFRTGLSTFRSQATLQTLQISRTLVLPRPLWWRSRCRGGGDGGCWPVPVAAAAAAAAICGG
ncbi:unnamed protein product [Phaeothamnion confervicola]